MLSEFFILTARGDTIVHQDYRGDGVRGIADLIFRTIRDPSGGGEAPPAFQLEGFNVLFVKKSGLILACTTRFNVSPSLVLELLSRFARVLKDYCGILTEESVRKNFVLCQELAMEIMDYGYPQTTSTESLRACIHNEPIIVDSVRRAAFKVPNMNPSTVPSTAVHKPIATASQRGGKNEIFVDILENISQVFSSAGYVLNSSIDGRIQMKSYLSGNPDLRLALNEDLIVGKQGGGAAYGAVVLDDCNFHECVRLDEFENQRILSFTPPDGEFTVMNYRVTGEFRSPFRVFPSVEELSPYKLELIVMVRADMPEANYGANVTITVPVPRGATTVHAENSSAGAVGEFRAAERKVVWSVRKFVGGTEQTLRARITLREPVTTQQRKELGPVAMSFEIPMYNVSQLQVKYLRIAEAANYNPYRWVRYVTTSQSYVCRM